MDEGLLEDGARVGMMGVLCRHRYERRRRSVGRATQAHQHILEVAVLGDEHDAGESRGGEAHARIELAGVLDECEAGAPGETSRRRGREGRIGNRGRGEVVLEHADHGQRCHDERPGEQREVAECVESNACHEEPP